MKKQLHNIYVLLMMLGLLFVAAPCSRTADNANTCCDSHHLNRADNDLSHKDLKNKNINNDLLDDAYLMTGRAMIPCRIL